jgi:hypothetical protein
MPDLPTSAGIDVSVTGLGDTLRHLLYADELKPGDEPSYQICKALFTFHPLGSKIAEAPIKLALSQERDISVGERPGKDELIKAYKDEWKRLGVNDVILNLHTQSRVYGLASVGLGEVNVDPGIPLRIEKLWDSKVFLNVWDPLNTAGLIVDQDPNSPTFQKHTGLTVQGQPWHRSRTLTVQNEFPIFIAWTSSAFAFAGRSCYQRGFYPLKSFLTSMVTDDMVSRKAGLIVAHLEQPGSIVNRVWKAVAGFKRALLKEGRTDNVISVGIEEQIETLNMRNVNSAVETSRENILKNIATAVPMPAKLLTQEAFVKGFGEGTQDAAEIAEWVDGLRITMNPSFDFFDEVVRRRAWNEEFYATLQNTFPQSREEGGYGGVTYQEAYYEWAGGFTATWPNLLKEPESELVNVDDVRMKAIIAFVQVLLPQLDPENRAKALEWAVSGVAAHEHLFAGIGTLTLDFDALRTWQAEQEEKQNEKDLAEAEGSAEPSRAFSSHDSDARLALDGGAIADLVSLMERRRQGKR